MSDVEDFLEHHGVKGMRWGVRRRSDDSSGSSKPRKLKRKEVRAERDKFYQEKGQRLLSEISKDPKVLVKITTSPGSVPMIATGKEVLTHLKAGGYMDIRTTDIYARADKSGQYVINDKMNEKFVRSDRRKKND